MTSVRGLAFAVLAFAKTLKGFLKWLIANVGSSRGIACRVRNSYEIQASIDSSNVSYQKVACQCSRQGVGGNAE